MTDCASNRSRLPSLKDIAGAGLAGTVIMGVINTNEWLGDRNSIKLAGAIIGMAILILIVRRTKAQPSSD